MLNKKIIKVAVFDKNTPKNTVLTTNGDMILDNIVLKCESNENLFTGDYNLDLVAVLDKEGLYKTLTEEAILKVKMDYGDDIFRIAKVNKSNRDVKVFARQITIEETLNMWIVDVRPTNTSGQGALSTLKNNSIGKKDIELFSDIDILSTAYYMDISLYEALHNCDQSFMNRWGGEILRRGYTVTINKRIGADRGVQIRSGKNLTGFEAKTDVDKVVTRIVSKGFDGIKAKNFIDSPLINNYSSIKTKEIKYDFVKVKNDNNPDEGFNTLEEAQAELERLAQLEFSQDHIDEIRADYNINYIQLEKTEEYKNFTLAERAYLGDTINVFENKHNTNIHVRCFNKKYDVMKQKVISMQLTNTDIKQKNITTTDILSELNKIIKNTESNSVSDIIQSMINSGIKDSYVVPRQNEIIVADNKDLDKAINVVRINKNGLAFSQDGYYGNYKYGFTIDGIMNASLIATGILSTILIQNADGSLQIDLSSKNGIMTKKDGKNAIELAGTILKFFDWDGLGDAIGQIFSTRLGHDANKPGLVLANKKGSFLSLSYEKDGKYYPYIICDRDNINPDTQSPIALMTNVDFIGSQMWFGHGLNSIFRSTNNDLINSVKNKFTIIDKDSGYARFSVQNNRSSFYNGGRTYFEVEPGKFIFWDNGRAYFYKESNSDRIWCDDNFVVAKNHHINGNLTVSGNKNCVQKTKNYGDRLFYATEDSESFFTHTNPHALTVELSEYNTYERVVLIDSIFKECVNLEIDYIVDIHKVGWGDFRIKEQTRDYFIIESNSKDFEFKYTIKAKRAGFEEEFSREFFDIEQSSDIELGSDINLNQINDGYPAQNELWRLYKKQI